MTTREEIREWLNGKWKPENVTHMIVAYDEFDHDDYPVHVIAGEDVKERVEYYQTAPMSRVMEVYDYSLDLEKQLDEYRAWHI